jgi:hypothetical protein
MPGFRSAAASVALMLCIAVPWSIKAAGVHYSIRYLAWEVRQDWAFVDVWVDEQQVQVSDPGVRAIKGTLEADALWRRPPLSDLRNWGALEDWFDITQ